MKVVEVFESRPHKAVSCLVEREKEIREWNEQKLPKVLPGYSPGRREEESGREEEEEGKDSRERQVRYEIVQNVVAGSVEENTEEMRTWRSERLTEAEAPRWNGGVCEEAKI